MGKPGAGKAPRTRREVICYAEKHGGRIVEGGRHTKIYGPSGGSVPVPRHCGDLSRGTLGSIMKGLVRIGLLVLVLACPVALAARFILGLGGI